MELKKSDSLKIKQYAASVGLNPDNVYYQRVRCNNISTELAQWNVKSPNPRALLMSFGHVEWKPTITRLGSTAAGAQPFISNNVKASFKPGLPFHNACSSIRCQVNSANIDMARPSRYFEILSMMFAGKKASALDLSSGGGEFWDLDGAANTNLDVNLGGTYEDFKVKDKALLRNETNFFGKLIKSAGGPALNGNDYQISCIEPIGVPPFNPFATVTKDMPDYCWFKHMTPAIAKVNTLDLDFQFSNLSAAVLFTRFLDRTDGGVDGANATPYLTISDLAADLLLYWYNPPMEMMIPRELSFQTWGMREFPTKITGPVAGGLIANGASVLNVESQLIQLKEMPTLIIIHAEVDKDSVGYRSSALYYKPTGQISASIDNQANLDAYLEIEDLEVILGDRPQVINTSFTQEELYLMTLKNSKSADFPYGYTEWKGSTVANSSTVLSQTVLEQMGKCFIAMRPEDLSSEFPDGVNASTTLQFRMKVTAHADYCGFATQAGSANRSFNYTMYTHVFFGKRMLTLSSDRGVYSVQNVPQVSYRSMLSAGSAMKAPDVEETGGYVSRAPM